MVTFKKSGLKRNECASACSKCRKRCCSHIPGIVHPCQLTQVTPEVVLGLLTEGYCVDWYEGDVVPGGELNKVMYIRPRMMKSIHRVESPDWAGGAGSDCTFLTPKGCSKEFNNRPLECQDLVPNEAMPGQCQAGKYDSEGKQGYSLAWRPYQHVIQKALDMYYEKGL